MKLLVVAIACVALSSCATPPGRTVAVEARSVLAAKPPVDVSRLEFAPVVLGQALDVSLGNESRPIVQGGRLTYARGIRLPDGEDRLRIRVSSLAFGGLSGKAILYPDVAWLDEDFRVVGGIPSDRYAYRTSAGADVLTADAFLDARAQGAKYLIVTERSIADAEETVVQTTVTNSTPIIVPIPGMIFVWMIPSGGTSPPAKVAASPVGRIEIFVERPTLSRIEAPRPPVPESVR